MTKVNNPMDETLSQQRALSSEEEALLWQASKSGDSKARDQLVERHLHLIHKIACKVIKELERKGYHGLEPRELWGAGTEGLLNAVSKYDQQRGKHFSSYARVCIKNAVLEAVMDSFMIRAPKHRLSVFKKINQTIKELWEVGIEQPSNELIAEKVGTTVKIVSDLRSLIGKVLSFDDSISGGDSLLRKIDDIDKKCAQTSLDTLLEKEEDSLNQALFRCYENALRDMGLNMAQDRRLFEEGSDSVYEMRLFFSRLLTEESAWKFIGDIRTREGDPYSNRIRWIRGIL